MAAKRRGRRRSGDLRALKVEVWAAIRYLADTIEDAEASRESRLRACSAMATCAGVYKQLLETGELETCLAALEGRLSRGV
jgi:hypothetical protein